MCLKCHNGNFLHIVGSLGDLLNLNFLLSYSETPRLTEENRDQDEEPSAWMK